MSKPGTENQKPGANADRGQTGQRAARSATRATLEDPQKRGLGRIFAALLEQRAWRFGPRVVPYVPCRRQRPFSGFQPLVLTKQLSKVNG